MRTITKIMICTIIASLALSPLTVLAKGGKGHNGADLRVHGKSPMSKSGIHMQGKHNKLNQPRLHGGHMSKQTLFKLLAEKYAPDTLADWEKTIADHQSLRTEIAGLAKTRAKLRAMIKSQHTEDFKMKMEANLTIRKQFQDALRSKDAVKIRTSLDALLQQLKQRNQLLAAKLTELKKAASTP